MVFFFFPHSDLAAAQRSVVLSHDLTPVSSAYDSYNVRTTPFLSLVHFLVIHPVSGGGG